MTQPVEDYLDELYRRLRADPRAARRTLDEVGDHLRESADRLEREGLDRVEAERAAVSRFGTSEPIVRAARLRATRALAADVAVAGLRLGAVGLVAIGLSGGVAAIFNAAFGDSFVGGVPGQLLLGGAGTHPVSEAAADAVSLRVLAGAVGLVLLAADLLLRRRRSRLRVVPAVMVDVVAAVVFGAAAAVLGVQSIDLALQHGSSGVGWPLSGAAIAAVAATGYLVRAVRGLIAPAPALR